MVPITLFNTLLQIMKKLVFALALISGVFFFTQSEAYAQEVEVTTKTLDLKDQAKLIKAQQKLEKKEAQLLKATQKRQKDQAKFEKKNSQGKLSPNAVSKLTKSLDKQRSKIEKLQKDIEKLEKYIREKSEY